MFLHLPECLLHNRHGDQDGHRKLVHEVLDCFEFVEYTSVHRLNKYKHHGVFKCDTNDAYQNGPVPKFGAKENKLFMVS